MDTAQVAEPAGRTPDTVLAVTGLSKSFPGVRALRNVSLDLRAGEVHALVGENGAGKSTLIKVMTGVYQPDEGEITYLGNKAQFASPLEAQQVGISTIYQEINLVPLMSVARNLFLDREPRRFGLIDIGRMKEQAHQILRRYGVDVDVSRQLRSLGLGAQQMVAIARAVQVDARVVIMDEPTSSLEQREVQTLFSVIRRLRDEGIAIVYVSHRMSELYEICDRVTVMRDGSVVHVSDMADLQRVQLVSLMLGREISEVRKHGTTAFGEIHQVDGPPVLRATGLSRRHQLSDVSLEIRPGEVVGLGGLLGSGRSETAKAIVGALSLDSGSVEIDGKTVTHHTTAAAIKAGVVMLPEDRKTEGIIPNLSVRENIVLAALPRISRLGLVTRSKQDEIVDYFMGRLKIKASSPEQRVGDLSGGNQQKVMLARWLCLNPKVLLLDEPTRGIDVGAKAEVQSLIDELAKDGLGVLLISSEVDELIEGSDRLVILKEGQVVGELAGGSVNETALMDALAGGEPAAESTGGSAAAPTDHETPKGSVR